MAARTLNTTWKQFEKLAERYFQKKAPKSVVEELNTLVDKTNDSKFVNALARLLLEPYPNLGDLQIRFAQSEGKSFPDWLNLTDATAKEIQVNPIGVLAFAARCRAEAARDQREANQTETRHKALLNGTPEAELPAAAVEPAEPETLAQRRMRRFMAQLSKLPSRLLLFMAILDGVARYKEVCKADKRAGSSLPVDTGESEAYLNLLWAFKELEQLIQDTTGINLRTEYNVTWYECQWAEKP
ncbi:MAG: hypothetical protein WC789_09740 [Lentisphaeria bacterium]|jgi:hypothetical protein